MTKQLIAEDKEMIESEVSKAADELQSIITHGSKASDFKTPDLLITDHVFKPLESEEMKMDPVLGVQQIDNFYTIDWQALKKRTMQDWSDVCQEQYNKIVKAGNL